MTAAAVKAWRVPVALLLALLPAAPAAAQDLRISHVTIVSPERVAGLPDAEVRIHDGRIVAITTGAGRQRQAAPAPSPRSTAADCSDAGPDRQPRAPGHTPGMTGEQEAQHPELAQRAWEQMPRSFLLYGFTTLVDLISTPQELARWKSRGLTPDTYFCGGAGLIDGYPMNFMPKPARYQSLPYMLIEPQSAVPAGIERAAHTPAAVVARMRADGAICVKTFYERGFGATRNLPVPQLATIRELVSAAHAAGLPVLMHANSTEAQAFGLEAGVDILAHGLWNWNDAPAGAGLTPAVKKVLDGVLTARVGWQPTLQVLYGERDLFNPAFLSDPQLARVLPADLIAWYRSPQGQWFHDVLAQELPQAAKLDGAALQAQVFSDYAVPIERAARATAYLSWYGGRLLFGTDTPSAPTYANPPGLNGWFEMQRLQAAGLTPAQIWSAATWANARAPHLDREIGTVEVGKKANLLLLREDPTRTIQAYASIVKIVLGGRVLDPPSSWRRACPRRRARPGAGFG